MGIDREVSIEQELMTGWTAPNVQNVVNVAIVAAFVAQNAYFPPKWQADVRETSAELAF